MTSRQIIRTFLLSCSIAAALSRILPKRRPPTRQSVRARYGKTRQATRSTPMAAASFSPTASITGMASTVHQSDLILRRASTFTPPPT